MKEIVFVLNIEDWQEFINIHDDYTECATYEDTDFAIKKNINKIITTSIAHCNNNILKQDYKTSLYHNGKIKKIKENTLLEYINNNIYNDI